MTISKAQVFEAKDSNFSLMKLLLITRRIASCMDFELQNQCEKTLGK